ncbi:hypothetical protein HER10_EVM0011367 [Colletotrichum scovillei]|uniref:uncharacterized protein n=1 Tax=Colletotrichum scovillei TaxID=1209932 RepID=UPI0015C30DD3|nr:uncharacterized protein HER10_EVM0011367 [Colletotrichum scovillei]KAF4784705.1 hypothetical protein HER10_EVM0011367 [Colletotrichum scovillei]
MAGFTSTLPRTLLSPSLYSHVHNVWFQGVAPHAKVASREAMTRWFGQGSPEDPENIAGPLMQSINTSDGETKSMQTLALVLLLDQMPRNIFRTRQAVIYTHYDRLARAVLRSLMSAESRPDMHPSLRLAPARRMWFYMPLMHSEHVEDHETYIKVVSEMQEEFRQQGDKQSEDYIGDSLEFEKKHKHLIERFGRYPHRNAQLGRSMTKEEEEYLRSGGEHFGTAA